MYGSNTKSYLDSTEHRQNREAQRVATEKHLAATTLTCEWQVSRKRSRKKVEACGKPNARRVRLNGSMIAVLCHEHEIAVTQQGMKVEVVTEEGSK